MSQSIVVKSFAELAELIELDDLPAESITGAGESLTESESLVDTVVDLGVLLAELQAASATLTSFAHQDEEAREVALRDLEQYEGFVAQEREGKEAAERARQLREQAKVLIKTAFTEAARAAATRVDEIAAQTEMAAAELAKERREAAECLATRIDVERLLDERHRQEAAEKEKVAEAKRARRLSEALAEVQMALQAGRVEEAKELLESVASDYPDSSEIASLREMIVQRELSVKLNAAEEALWEVRRNLRRDAEAAVAHLEDLDVAGLPEALAKQVFGEWARACSRLCRERGFTAPLRYSPDLGRGAVIARESSDACYTVVSALGMEPSWTPGSVVGERQIRRARPLQ